MTCIILNPNKNKNFGSTGALCDSQRSIGCSCEKKIQPSQAKN